MGVGDWRRQWARASVVGSSPLAWRMLAWAAATLSFGLAVPALGAPSFDCAKARTPDELSICGDEQLAEVDTLVAKAFRTFKPSFQKAKTVALRLLKDRNACGTDKTCIIGVQAMTLQTFSKPVAWVTNTFLGQLGRRAAALARENVPLAREMPGRVAECVKTRITAIETRFGDPVARDNEDAGTHISYACRGGAVTYDREAWMYKLKPGDAVVVCLTFVPHDCPVGDNRGYEFYVFHPATGASSTLPDTSHGCGGA